MKCFPAVEEELIINGNELQREKPSGMRGAQRFSVSILSVSQ